jgi:hypothetical protein
MLQLLQDLVFILIVSLCFVGFLRCTRAVLAHRGGKRNTSATGHGE